MKLLVRPASVGDIPALARFAAAHNADPRQRCLFLGESIPEIESDFDDRFAGAPEEGFVLAENGDGIVGAMGCAVDAATLRGWLAGPWVASDPFDETAVALFTALRERLGRRVALFDAFVDAEAAQVIRFYTEQGFRARKRAHIYTAPRPADAALLPVGDGPLRAATRRRSSTSTLGPSRRPPIPAPISSIAAANGSASSR